MSITERLNPVYAAAVLFPALCVLGSQFIGQGTSSARALGEAQAVFEPMHSEPIKIHIPKSEAPSFSAARSPFYFEPVKQTQGLRTGVSHQVRPQGETQVQLPDVHVTSILPNPKNPLAIIDGKPRRIGDTLDSGWTVISINASDFTVTLRHSSGQEIREGMKKN